MRRLRSQRPRGPDPDAVDPRMLLVLDLDETLIHATQVFNSRPPDHVVFEYGVYLRPGLGMFLEHVARMFRVAVWTSSSLDYAEQVCALILPDPAGRDFLWARDKCTVWHDWEQQTGCYAKRLRKLKRYGYDLNGVLVVDDSPEKHTHNYGNLVHIAPFTGDPADVELAHLARYLSHCRRSPTCAASKARLAQRLGQRHCALRREQVAVPSRLPSTSRAARFASHTADHQAMDSMQAAADSGSQPAGLEAVRRAIVAACERAGRDPRSVTLVAVSKTVPANALQATLAAGQRVYGENRVQEALQKWPALRVAHADLELHLIGPLQTNKVRSAVACFDVIQCVDRPSLAEALARECEKQVRRPALFIQVNTGLEPQKAGVSPAETDSLVATCRQHGLQVQGLMCTPPAVQPPQPHFTLLAELAARNGLSCLSMGMSADFALAIAHGATHVRVGTAIFGTRPQP